MQALQKLIESTKNTAKIVYLDNQYDPKNLEKEVKELVKKSKATMPAAGPKKVEKK